MKLLHKITTWFWTGGFWSIFIKIWILGMAIQYGCFLFIDNSLIKEGINTTLLLKVIPFETALIAAFLSESHKDFVK